MEDADREVAQLAGGEPLRLDLGRPALQLLGLVDQRADDVGLAALAQLAADELVGAGALVLLDHPRLDRLAPGGQLVQRGRVEVAVGGQRERARDRRRGHVQDVRRHPLHPLGVERPALLDPEAVLLVDDAEAEAGELDRRLDQRVGADDQAQLAGREPLQRFLAPRRRRRPGQQRERGRLFGQQLAERHRVLLGQGLGRRHQHRLEAGFQRPQHRVDGDDGLAATRPRPSAAAASARPESRSASISSKASSWSRVGSNGSDSIQRPTSSPGLPSLGAGLDGPVRPLPRRQDRLVEEQLFERAAAPAPARRPPRVSGKCTALIASATPAKPAPHPQLRRQRLDHVRRPSRIACSTHCRIRCASAARPDDGQLASGCRDGPGSPDSARPFACRSGPAGRPRSRIPRPGSPVCPATR